MKAGRELDALVAEKVMGWGWFTFKVVGVATPCRARYLAEHAAQETDEPWRGGEMIVCRDAKHDVPHYSTDITAAMSVCARLRADPRDIRATLTERSFPAFAYLYRTAADPEGRDYIDGWTCEFRDCGAVGHAVVERGAPTLPHAICLAALASINAEPSTDGR